MKVIRSEDSGQGQPGFSVFRDWVRKESQLSLDKLDELDLRLPDELAEFLSELLGPLDCEITDYAVSSEYDDLQIPLHLLLHGDGEAYLIHVDALILRQPDRTFSRAMFALLAETNLARGSMAFMFSATLDALVASWDRYFDKEWKEARAIRMELVPWTQVVALEQDFRDNATGIKQDATHIFKLDQGYWTSTEKGGTTKKHSSLEDDDLVVLADCLQAQASVLGTDAYKERLDAAIDSLHLPKQWKEPAKSAVAKGTNAARGVVDVLASKGIYHPQGHVKMTPLGALIQWLVVEMGGSAKAESLVGIAEAHSLLEDDELQDLRNAATP